MASRGALDDFDVLRQLSEQELRELVKDTDPRTRLHAVWALGLRVSPVTACLPGEPDPGVRRGLAVVLASVGELDLLVALCRHDPSVHVRASTVQMVMRFAKAGRIPWSIVQERLGDAPEVRAALVSQIDASMPEAMREAAIAALADPEEIVRREAFEACISLADASCLRDALERMSRSECGHAMAKWFAVADPDVIARALTGASQQAREVAIRTRPDLAFGPLLPLVDVGVYAALGHKLGDAPPHLALQVLESNPWRHDLLSNLLARVRRGELAVEELTPHTAKLRACWCETLSEIEHELSWSDLDEYERDEIVEQKLVLEDLIARLDQLVR